ncbi:MAG: hypothetical protein NUV50_09580, partial [Rhodospirillales bacterium]|nr:hypothetical protein [Rhodospirillales bacterium]
HCVSENQKKSAILIASSLETVNHAKPTVGSPLIGPNPNIAAAQKGSMHPHTCGLLTLIHYGLTLTFKS